MTPRVWPGCLCWEPPSSKTLPEPLIRVVDKGRRIRLLQENAEQCNDGRKNAAGEGKESLNSVAKLGNERAVQPNSGQNAENKIDNDVEEAVDSMQEGLEQDRDAPEISWIRVSKSRL